MKQKLASLLLALMIVSGPANAACYADYKAKKDNPLQLHYGVIELPDRSCGSARAAANEIRGRIGRDGWTLLNVVSVFGRDQLAGRQSSAGQFFLRY